MQEPQYRNEGYESEPRKSAEPAAPREKDSFISFLGELPVLVLTAIVVAWLIKSFIIQPFFIPTGSMEPTLLPGDRVMVSKFSYRLREPVPGDIIVFIAPEAQGQAKQDLIKRVVATAGMTVEVNKGKLYVNGKLRTEPFTRADLPESEYGPSVVPKSSLFVMGDNRANSKDSRFFGPVQKKDVIGKAVFIYWPPNRLGLL